ncbi:MAG: hypothetical protein Q4D11_04830 [Rhodospirillales bacterium]|nr:hypothetical protein [Rhodospirillales bacterium]
MVKNKSSFLAGSGKIFNFLLKTTELIVLLSVIGIAIFVWQKPQYLLQWLKVGDNQLSSANSAKIEAIENKLEVLNLITANSGEKYDLIQQKFEHFDKSKADTDEIINLNNQINSVRNFTQKLSQTSNTGALLLTSAMLIRDNTLKGLNCKNEAEGLKILAQNIDSVSQDVEFVSSHCNMDFVSDKTITKNFNNIYNQIEENLKPQEAQNWKQRLSEKLGEYVQISKHKQQQTEEYNLLEALLPVKNLANNGDFSLALKELSKPENQNLLADENIQNWYTQTKNQIDFYQYLSNIINASLLIMKVENAQNSAE